MKNMKIYRKAAALVLATSITLLTGCTGKKDETENIQSQETTQPVEFYLSDEQEQLSKVDTQCRHIIVYFGEQAVVLRQCEGYRISMSYSDRNSRLYYVIGEDSVLESGATNYNFYYTNHQDAYMLIENEAIEKGAKVLKIK